MSVTLVMCTQGTLTRGILDELEELSRKEYVPRYYKALVYAGLEQKDQAFAELEGAFREHDVTMVILDTDPIMDSLRGDARLDSLLERLGLAPQLSPRPF